MHSISWKGLSQEFSTDTGPSVTHGERKAVRDFQGLSHIQAQQLRLLQEMMKFSLIFVQLAMA
jgi:hypothetical protein